MIYKTADELIIAFIEGATDGMAVGGKLRIESGNKIVNYATCLVEADDERGWLMNVTKYSPTTTTYQNKIVKHLNSYRSFPTYFAEVPKGTKTLVGQKASTQ